MEGGCGIDPAKLAVLTKTAPVWAGRFKQASTSARSASECMELGSLPLPVVSGRKWFRPGLLLVCIKCNVLVPALTIVKSLAV